MKQKKIESKLTKAKKRLGKITANVSRWESRLEKVVGKKEGKTELSVEETPESITRPKAASATSAAKGKKTRLAN